MKVTLELLLEKGLTLEEATVIEQLIDLYKYNNYTITEKKLDIVIEKLKKKRK